MTTRFKNIEQLKNKSGWFKKLPFKKSAKRSNNEEIEQMIFFQWVRIMEKRMPDLKWLMASANGFRLGWKQITKLKKLGIRKGEFDVKWLKRVGIFSGLHIEMKVGYNKLTAEQKEYQKFLEANGFKTATCYSANEAIEEVKKYVGL